jgi:sensor histidine kinase YesM
MFKKLAQWHNDWEDEMLDVLANPAHASRAAPGFRRCIAVRLAEMSAIERSELHAFSAKYRGARMYSRLAMMMVVFALAGVVLFLSFPNKSGLLEAVLIAEAVCLTISLSLIGIWFNYRYLTRLKLGKVVNTFVLSTLAALASMSAVFFIKGQPVWSSLMHTGPKVAQGMVVGGGGTLLLLGMVALYRNRQYDALTVQLQHDAERDRLARQLSESQLRLLRSQIEPHFLFNTLGAVQQLAEQGAPRAAELTANLIAFLRASMEEMRSEQVSLAEEFRLVEAYLQVMQARLGSRLRYTLQLPESLCAAPVPGMVVLTLVENAIKHGIEPALRGGEVTVTAMPTAGGVDIEVRDSGAGLAPVPGQGFGLQNVRERLQLAYHGAGSFALRDAPQGGTLAALHLPTLATQAP